MLCCCGSWKGSLSPSPTPTTQRFGVGSSKWETARRQRFLPRTCFFLCARFPKMGANAEYVRIVLKHAVCPSVLRLIFSTAPSTGTVGFTAVLVREPCVVVSELLQFEFVTDALGVFSRREYHPIQQARHLCASIQFPIHQANSGKAHQHHRQRCWGKTFCFILAY